MSKITILAVATCLSLAATPLRADDAHHPEKAQRSADTKTAAPTAKPADTDLQIKQAQETMRKLQGQADRIRQATDPKERQKLTQVHLQTMREGMKQLRGMGRSKMMMGMSHDGNDGQQGGMMMGGDMMKMHDMMEMRMEMMGMMMETMMEQMMRREEIRGSIPAK